MARTRIVALVGTDGAGKTTQARVLAAWLNEHGYRADYWRNAGGRRWFTRLAQRLGRDDADALLGRDGLLLVEAVLRWLSIARAVLRSGLRGRIAVMDRYSYCQYANVRANGGWGERLARLLFAAFPTPDLTCHLRLSPEEAHRRIEVRGTDHESVAVLEALDRAYAGLPEAPGFVVIDASGTPAAVHQAIRRAVVAGLSLTNSIELAAVQNPTLKITTSSQS